MSAPRTASRPAVPATRLLSAGYPAACPAARATQLTLVLPAASAFPCQATRTVALQVGTSGGIGVV